MPQQGLGCRPLFVEIDLFHFFDLPPPTQPAKDSVETKRANEI
jgi:hypothetical protein